MDELFARQETHIPRLLAKSFEWYTPVKYVNAARKVMDGIELDPASNAIANQAVQARRYYDVAANGLKQDWKAKSVWLNPPYCKEGAVSNQGVWTCKLIAEYEAGHVEQAILLVNAATETQWFQRLYAYPLCFTNHRIQFYGQENKSGPTVGQAFVYFGTDASRFIEVFSQFGTVVKRLSPAPVSLWDGQQSA